MTYLDHHASTPLEAATVDALRDAARWAHGNASSVHGAGRRLRGALERAREALGAALDVHARELVFTSGGTEAVALAVCGVGEGVGARAVCVEPTAHPALRAAVARLAARLGVLVEPLPLHAGGLLDVPATAALLERLPAPVLGAVTLAHHETGVLAPLEALRRAVDPARVVLVADAVQAVGKVPLALASSGLAAAALSAHKFGGPPGVGATWLRVDARARAQLEGGGQERGLRAGSENTLGLVALAATCAALPARLAAMTAVAARRDALEAAVTGLDEVVRNGAEHPRVSTVTNCSLRGVAGDELVAALDLEGVYASAGPACSSGRAGPSEALRAAYPDEPWRAASALRLSLGPETTDEDVAYAARVLARIVPRLRANRDAEG